MSYVSELQIDGGSIIPFGSALYGTCSTPMATAAKEVTLNSFDNLIHGVTVHVKFNNGNSVDVSPGFTLKVGTTDSQPISNPGGTTKWSAGAVVSFTYDETIHSWIVNDSDKGVELAIANTYNSNSQEAISGQGVADALDTLGDAAEKNVITTIIESGANANKTSTDLPTTNAITTYIDNKTLGITGAMHFVGRTTSEMSDGSTTAEITINGNAYIPNPGDVVLSGNHKEYVWAETNVTTHAGYWELLGDEGSYALKTVTENVIKTATFTPDVPGSLTTKDTAVPNITTVGQMTTAQVDNAVLKISTGSVPVLGNAITIKEVDVWTPGTAASLNTTTQSVVVPEAT